MSANQLITTPTYGEYAQSQSPGLSAKKAIQARQTTLDRDILAFKFKLAASGQNPDTYAPNASQQAVKASIFQDEVSLFGSSAAAKAYEDRQLAKKTSSVNDRLASLNGLISGGRGFPLPETSLPATPIAAPPADTTVASPQTPAKSTPSGTQISRLIYSRGGANVRGYGEGIAPGDSPSYLGFRGTIVQPQKSPVTPETTALLGQDLLSAKRILNAARGRLSSRLGRSATGQGSSQVITGRL